MKNMKCKSREVYICGMEKGQGSHLFHTEVLAKNSNFKKITKLMNLRSYFSANIRLLKIGIRHAQTRI